MGFDNDDEMIRDDENVSITATENGRLKPLARSGDVTEFIRASRHTSTCKV
jgi:hypothetical protein